MPPAASPPGPHFTPALFAFLQELRENNDRAWFEANRDRFEDDVREPLIRFVIDFAPRLQKISPHFVADPRPNGGSIFRIYRDTRFSKDKTPYKTNAGIHFRHAAGKDAHAPGFYLNLAPGQVFMACGLWRPDAPALALVRAAIVDQPGRWQKLKSSLAPRFALEGEQLARPPRGFDADHPHVEDLRRKDFVVSTSFTDAEACAPDFIKRYADACRAAASLVKFLTEALGQPF
ncbi:MAG TPA: DUF2461 domain-containing protein [Chloroflexota bacterium]|nr:DUF2461 domain-containing protein [Chloroflexota bacterium]